MLTGLDTAVQDEHGNIGEMPMVCEGYIYDYDGQFILLGNERATVLSLLSLNNIGKIDFIDEGELQMLDPDKPNLGDMN